MTIVKNKQRVLVLHQLVIVHIPKIAEIFEVSKMNAYHAKISTRLLRVNYNQAKLRLKLFACFLQTLFPKQESFCQALLYTQSRLLFESGPLWKFSFGRSNYLDSAIFPNWTRLEEKTALATQVYSKAQQKDSCFGNRICKKQAKSLSIA